MRLHLSSKDCVRLGVMKGCCVLLEDIVFADDEVLPYELVAGHPHSLTYMPITFLFRAEGVAWTLPPEDPPSDLPQGFSRRGLFQVQRSYDYLNVLVGEDCISVYIYLCCIYILCQYANIHFAMYRIYRSRDLIRENRHMIGVKLS